MLITNASLFSMLRASLYEFLEILGNGYNWNIFPLYLYSMGLWSEEVQSTRTITASRKYAMFSLCAVLGATTLAIAGTLTTSAFAQVCTTEMQACNKGDPRTTTGTGQPDIPSCWGQVSSGLAQTGTMGKHVSNPIPSDPDPDSPRLGLGNTVEGTPMDHGVVVGPQFGQTCT